MGKIYQYKYKNQFIIEEKVPSNLYKWIFNFTFHYEEKFGKDLFDFTVEQMIELLKSREMNVDSLRTLIFNIQRYATWAQNKGYRLLNIKYTKEISDKDLEKLATKSRELLHINEIQQLIGAAPNESIPPLNNIQDQLLIYLIFIGVRGNSASELTQLTYDHIDGNKIKLSEISEGRQDIIVDDFGKNLLMKNKRNEYFGYLFNDRNSSMDYELVDSTYIFRPIKRRKGGSSDSVSNQTLIKRLEKITRHTGLSVHMGSIERAGMMYFYHILKESGEDMNYKNPVIVKNIFDRYNISKKEISRFQFLRRLEKDYEVVYANNNNDSA